MSISNQELFIKLLYLQKRFTNDELSLHLSNPVSPLKSNPLELWEDMKTVFPPILYKQSRITFSMLQHRFLVKDYFLKLEE